MQHVGRVRVLGARSDQAGMAKKIVTTRSQVVPRIGSGDGPGSVWIPSSKRRVSSAMGRVIRSQKRAENRVNRFGSVALGAEDVRAPPYAQAYDDKDVSTRPRSIATNQGVVGSNPAGRANFQRHGPDTWVTVRTYGECQDCCRVSHAATCCGARSGLSTASPTGNQFLVEPVQRSGFARRARSYSSCRLARTAPSCPL